ncbi:ABC transporter ATP-binding protein [Alicyclobacillus tolerans]|uniref:ABC-2 type transport system ATP-binding protein n=2 Tax=Alicyclobacillus tolerans TaxID=90970 RepID=A0A1M6K2R6_9BACL|nr:MULTISPECIES: ABC transporter ATP-binding protein [Alicyclobacillus]MDP9727325.1 ABC-2 type transport system ATP-binding protein [Alicyclobacillus tengchongensis]QRF23073.1 ABC transporter ATP-binding protein [Alicyclobacillus sp. TC]SHJ53184.1 ABC-2 type transport system ATP-binding protein [Alicyclobacillus montanus]
MIQTQHLTKKFGRFTAVDKLNLYVPEGTVFGLVGENGAGKTTTLSMLATLSTPTSGKAVINGYDVVRHPSDVRRSIGFMPDSFGVYDDLSVDEYLEFYADCYAVPRAVMQKRRQDLLERVQLVDKRHTYVNALSRGMQQRLEIARCLMHNPPVLILDEPASGLDPRSRIELRSVLKELKALKKTVVISSHILYELAEFADEIGILRRGQIAAVASVSVMLQHSSSQRTLWIATKSSQHVLEQALRDVPEVSSVTYFPEGVEVIYQGTLEEQSELLLKLLRRGVRVSQFAERPTDIEALFLRLTSEREEGGSA